MGDTRGIWHGSNQAFGSPLYSVTLREYLARIAIFTNEPGLPSLLAPARDARVTLSSQACLLPLRDGRVEFAVSLCNRASTPDEPAVLVIVASATGTSAQVAVDRRNLLKCNKHGQACDFVAERLSGGPAHADADADAAMSPDESAHNKLLIVQVPLRTSRPVAAGAATGAGAGASRGVDAAGVLPSEAKGPWPSLARYRLERDPALPIRITVQYYHVTDSPATSAAQVAALVGEVEELYDAAAPWNRDSTAAGGDGGSVSGTGAFLAQPPASRPWVWGFWEPVVPAAAAASASAAAATAVGGTA